MVMDGVAAVGLMIHTKATGGIMIYGMANIGMIYGMDTGGMTIHVMAAV
jgi:hypothetical protein